MNWATEPEEDRDLVERGARAFTRAVGVAVVLLMAALVWRLS